MYIDRIYIDDFYGREASREIPKLTDIELIQATKELIRSYKENGSWDWGDEEPAVEEIADAARRYYPEEAISKKKRVVIQKNKKSKPANHKTKGQRGGRPMVSRPRLLKL